MKRVLTVAAVIAIAIPAFASSELTLGRVNGVNHAHYGIDGKLSPMGERQTTTSMWDMTVNSSYYWGSMASDTLPLDWGDIEDGAVVEGLAFAYAVPVTLTDPETVNCTIVYYSDYNGFNNNGFYVTFGFAYSNLPTTFGTNNGWTITSDLEPNFTFPITGNDLDGDGKADFGYSYWFPDRFGQGLAIGPFLVNYDTTLYPRDPNNVGDPNYPYAPDTALWEGLGAEEGFDRFTDPNTFTYLGTSWFGGWIPGDPNTVFSQFYMNLFGQGGVNGACCLFDGACLVTTELDCISLSGTYLGDGTDCFVPGYAVLPGDGVEFYRLHLTYPGAEWFDSDYGQAVIDINQLTAVSGVSQGFLNVYTNQGWVVRNVLIDLASGYGALSVMFDLGPYAGVDDLDARRLFSPDPIVCADPPPLATFTVGRRNHNAQGGGGEPGQTRPAPPTLSIDLTGFLFFPSGETVIHWQPGHRSVEQDTNQCGPAAVANSLDWMRDKYGIKVPDALEPGIRDDTLPGELDKDMNRNAHQVVTSAAHFVDGKVRYIDTENLTDEVHVKHKSRTGINWLPNDRTVGDATSHVNDDPNTSLMDWLIDEVEAGEDVEIRIGWDGGGGHYVCLTGAGRIFGRPYITWVHDEDQGHNGNDVDENGGTSPDDPTQAGHGWSWVDEANNNKMKCYIEGATGEATIDYAVSESPNYPKDRACQYTITDYGAGGGLDEDGYLSGLYDDPVWTNDTTLQIDNVAVPTQYKTVYLNIIFDDAQTTTPNISITRTGGVAPMRTSTEWRDYDTNLLFTWEFDTQPESETITFPSADFRNSVGIKRLGIATYCQEIPDCNGNGIDDRTEIDSGSATDANGNDVPDECDEGDCNGNLTPDIDDIGNETEPDCNENGLPDSCDVADPTNDCNGNGIPDSCDTNVGGESADCNGNRIPDDCDISSGASFDVNANGVPDECECIGDLNGDGFRNLADLAQLLANYGTFTGGTYEQGDMDGDGDIDLADLAALLSVYGLDCP